MGSKKRKREKRCIHPRNKYAQNPPDFSLLASLYPSFASFVFLSPHPRIDWTDFDATRELTRVLLHHHHSLNWWIPDGQLCPTVPNRLNYIHWIEDLLASDIIDKTNTDEVGVRGFDIGTGANCIYPLLGASLLRWSFVGSDVTAVASEWAEKNVKSNPHISELIEIRNVGSVGNVVELSGNMTEDDSQMKAVFEDSIGLEMKKIGDSVMTAFGEKMGNKLLVDCKEVVDLSKTKDDATEPGPSCPFASHSNVDKGYHGPPVLVGVVKEQERFDFCMCNPPFFESMEEAGLNPKTSCGGTPEEMVCPGGERAFITRIIEDSVILKQSFRWYTSMVGKKVNLKFLSSKLREVGVTIVKTTEFVQGQTCRWGLAWSFMPAAKNLVPSRVVERSNLSFMLEGFQRQASAFNALQSVEYFFNHFGASCKTNPSSFTVDVNVSNDHCDIILKTDVKKFDEASNLYVSDATNGGSCSHDPKTISFRVLVFQQIPGTLLVRGSLQQRDSSSSGTFTCVFQRLEEFLKHKFCRERACVAATNVNQIP